MWSHTILIIIINGVKVKERGCCTVYRLSPTRHSETCEYGLYPFNLNWVLRPPPTLQRHIKPNFSRKL